MLDLSLSFTQILVRSILATEISYDEEYLIAQILGEFDATQLEGAYPAWDVGLLHGGEHLAELLDLLVRILIGRSTSIAV